MVNGKRAIRLAPLLILLVAFGLRVWALETVPPGLTHDEATHLQDARRIWEGYRPLYLTSAYGREPLFDYASAPLVGLAGTHVFSGRLASALWGTALVGLLYAWVARAFDRPTALLAAALVALSFWPLSTSRQILRSTAMPTLLTAAVLTFWRAVYPPHPRENSRAIPNTASGKDALGQYAGRHFLLAGVILGLSWYTYMPARVTWLVPALFGLSLALFDPLRWRRVRAGWGGMLLAMAVLAAPLLVYLATHPGLEVRVTELAAPLRAFWGGDPGPLWVRLRETALLFSHRGDVHWMYNLSGRPLLAPALAGLFYLGLAAVIYGTARWRRPAYGLLLLWLLLGLAPALVTGLESSALRAIAAQPAVFVLVALPPAALGRRLWPRLGRKLRAGTLGLALVAAVALGARTAADYFDLWAGQRDTRVAYNTHMVAIGRYLEAHPSDAPVAVSTLYPGPFHDPALARVILGPAAGALRWFDARHALLFPDAEQARAVFPALVPLDETLQPLFQPTARLLERVELAPNDLSPWFEVYTWAPRAARAALPLGDPVDVGHVVAFLGYRLGAPAVAPGGTVELLTFWRVLDVPALADPDEEWVLFTHVLNAAGQIVGQQDRLDVPAWTWAPGDIFVQLHRFALDADLEPGSYPVKIGLFRRVQALPRLPVYDPGGAIVADHIALPAIEVVAP